MSLSAFEVSNYKRIIEALVMASDEPLSATKLATIFAMEVELPVKEIQNLLKELQAEYQEQNHGIELKQLSSGYAFQTKVEYASWVARLWEEKPPKYSRALLETLAIIAYRQPVTRPEIEAIRGVAVSSNIIKTLMDRDWIRIAGHRDVPGKPTLFITTSYFLDYFNLNTLSDLPKLASMFTLLNQVNMDNMDDINTGTKNNEPEIASEIEPKT